MVPRHTGTPRENTTLLGGPKPTCWYTPGDFILLKSSGAISRITSGFIGKPFQACRSRRSLSLRVRRRRLPLRDTEDHELGGPYNRHTNLRRHHSQISISRRIGFVIALDVKRLLRGTSEEHAFLPHHRQKDADIARDLGPQSAVVRLEYRPLRALVDRLSEKDQRASNAQVLRLPICV